MNIENNEKLDVNSIVYALNMCTVSVGQILHYKDIYVLEQEYNNILNNLNLSAMPTGNDEILSIITQILDTITFFRIDEEEKSMIEHEYEFMLRNAIWSALPNVSVLLGSSSMAISNIMTQKNVAEMAEMGAVSGEMAVGAAGGAATIVPVIAEIAVTIGMGYMNYRKNRSQILLNRDKDYFKLRKEELAQFNLLQRELFSTAWKLTDRYKIEDEMRLTDKQVNRFNEIISENDEILKYERLCHIKNEFTGYPVFDYYLANAAYTLARKDSLCLSEEFRFNLLNEAKTLYSRYLNNSNSSLLRKDYLRATCAIEYATLLFEEGIENNKEIIKECLDISKKNAGDAFDILQLCALAYIELHEVDEAIEILKLLYDERFNAVINGQILSIYYNLQNRRDEWELMAKQKVIKKEYLFPKANDNSNKEEDKRVFIKNQIDLLKEATGKSLINYYELKNKEFHSLMGERSNYKSYFEKKALEFLDTMIDELSMLMVITDDDISIQKTICWWKTNYSEQIKGCKDSHASIAAVFMHMTMYIIDAEVDKLKDFFDNLELHTKNLMDQDTFTEVFKGCLDFEKKLHNFEDVHGLLDMYAVRSKDIEEAKDIRKPLLELFVVNNSDFEERKTEALKAIENAKQEGINIKTNMDQLLNGSSLKKNARDEASFFAILPPSKGHTTTYILSSYGILPAKLDNKMGLEQMFSKIIKTDYIKYSKVGRKAETIIIGRDSHKYQVEDERTAKIIESLFRELSLIFETDNLTMPISLENWYKKA